jgi:hypothetical protein
VLFGGSRGAGKSTLAAHFNRRGFQVLTDDTAVLTMARAGDYRVWPDLRRLRLRPDAAERFGFRDARLEPETDRAEKVQVPLAPDLPHEGHPLAGLYVLSDAPPGGSTTITRLAGLAAIEAVTAHTFAVTYLAYLKMDESHLAQWTEFAATIPIYSVQRRRGFDVFEAETGVIERHARELVSGRA